MSFCEELLDYFFRRHLIVRLVVTYNVVHVTYGVHIRKGKLDTLVMNK